MGRALHVLTEPVEQVMPELVRRQLDAWTDVVELLPEGRHDPCDLGCRVTEDRPERLRGENASRILELLDENGERRCTLELIGVTDDTHVAARPGFLEHELGEAGLPYPGLASQ